MTDDPPTAGTPDTPSRPPGEPAPPPGAVVTDPPPSGGPPTAVLPTASAPPPPPTTAPGTDDPRGPTPPPGTVTGPRRPGPVGLAVALGVGLLGAAVALSTYRSRADGDIDWSNYTVGLGATAALLLVALGAAVVGGRGRARDDLVGWPGAVAALAAAAMLALGLDDVDGLDQALPYLAGGLIVLLSAAGYAAARHGALVVSGILGLALLYANLLDDVVVDLADEDDTFVVVAAAVAVFVLLVTALGWLLRTRVVSGVFVGALGVLAYDVLLLALLVTQAIGRFFGELEVMGEPVERSPDIDTDIYVLLGFALLLTLVWALAAALNGHPGFTVLAILMPVTVVPLATFLLAVRHPTWWGVGLAAAGAVVLGAAGALQLLSTRRGAT